MLRRMFLLSTAGALCLSASVAVYANAESSDLSDVPAISDITPSEGNIYYIFYKDIDTKEIDEIADQKRHEYIYSLYEAGADEHEVEEKSSDYYQEVRLGLVKAAYAEASARILEELGADSSAAFCSSYTPLIVCSLTEEQLTAARASENITDITAFIDSELHPDSEANDATSIGDAKKAMELLNACFKENNIDAKCVTSEEYPDYYPPLVIEYVAETATGRQIMGYVEENNINKSLFEVVPIINGQKTYWVYDTVNTGNIKGDANCDGKVDLADAIYIMQALANPNKYQISEQGRANADMDGDGLTVDDAQAIQRMLLGLDGSDSEKSIDNSEYLFGNEASYSVMTPQRLALNCNSFCANGDTLNVKMLMGDDYTYNQNHNSYPDFDSEGYPEYSIFATENFKKLDDERLVINGKQGGFTKSFSKDDMKSLDITGKEGDYSAYYSDTAEIDFSNYPSGTTGCISFSFGWRADGVNPYDPSSDFVGTSQTIYFYVGESGTGISNNGWEAAQIAYEAESDNDIMFYDSPYVKWNGKEVMSNLYDVLRKPNDEVLPITFKLSASPDYDFEYKGKKMSDYANANYSEDMQKLRDLMGYGNSLKYGEMLYTTGTPEGMKWTQEWYEDRIEYFGEEILSKYIVDGDFLEEDLRADINELMNNNRIAYDEAEKAYYSYISDEAIKQLDEQNIRYEYMTEPKRLVIYVTAEEFKSLSLDNVSRYGLDMSVAKGLTVDTIF